MKRVYFLIKEHRIASSSTFFPSQHFQPKNKTIKAVLLSCFGGAQMWLMGRVYRHLLVDRAGFARPSIFIDLCISVNSSALEKRYYCVRFEILIAVSYEHYPFSGMWCCIVLYIFTDVSNGRPAFIFRVEANVGWATHKGLAVWNGHCLPLGH